MLARCYHRAGASRCPHGAPAAPAAGPGGLLFDRHWALVDERGGALTLRRCPRLAALRPRVDLQRGVLVLAAAAAGGEGEGGVPPPLELPLDQSAAELWTSVPQQQREQHQHKQQQQQQQQQGAAPASAALTVRVCGRDACAERAVAGEGWEAPLGDWLAAVVGQPCRLVRQAPGGGGEGAEEGGEERGGAPSSTKSHASGGASSSPARSFANDAQLLLVSTASLADLRERVAAGEAGRRRQAEGEDESEEAFAARFRPNLLVRPGAAADEGAEEAAEAAAAAAAGGGGSQAAAGNAPSPHGGGLRAYAEDGWRAVRVGGAVLCSAGGCPRCSMVCACPHTGRCVRCWLRSLVASGCAVEVQGRPPLPHTRSLHSPTPAL